MHKQSVYKNNSSYTNGVSESLFKRGVCLLYGPMGTEEDVQYIVQCIKDAVVCVVLAKVVIIETYMVAHI